MRKFKKSRNFKKGKYKKEKLQKAIRRKVEYMQIREQNLEYKQVKNS